MEDPSNVKHLHIYIFHAPLPDGEDASEAYALRASKLITENAATTVAFVGSLTPEGGPLWDDAATKIINDEQAINVYLFLISCSADGSVDRSVRKVMRNLKDKSAQLPKDGNQKAPLRNEYSVVLLGHARCENSANQMKDTIFGTGRRFGKAMAVSSHFMLRPYVSNLEIQVELTAPEDEFDPWLKKSFFVQETEVGCEEHAIEPRKEL
mmetsp:Transcript_48923/g.58996  ORF Transcript_48923/g.58996 Transcript_48923/m.58996 type:complete len:209 (+) Transcript_48923:67-693(+)